jgi:hypothetical protein
VGVSGLRGGWVDGWWRRGRGGSTAHAACRHQTRPPATTSRRGCLPAGLEWPVPPSRGRARARRASRNTNRPQPSPSFSSPSPTNRKQTNNKDSLDLLVDGGLARGRVARPGQGAGGRVRLGDDGQLGLDLLMFFFLEEEGEGEEKKKLKKRPESSDTRPVLFFFFRQPKKARHALDLTSLNGSNTMPDILSAAVRTGAGPRAAAARRAGARLVRFFFLCFEHAGVRGGRGREQGGNGDT